MFSAETLHLISTPNWENCANQPVHHPIQIVNCMFHLENEVYYQCEWAGIQIGDHYTIQMLNRTTFMTMDALNFVCQSILHM